MGTPVGEPGFRQVSMSGYRVQYYAPDKAGDVLIIAVLGPGQP